MTYAPFRFQFDLELDYLESTLPRRVAIAEYRASRPRKPSLRSRLISQLRRG